MSKIKVSKILEPELFFDFLLAILAIVVLIVSWGYGFGSLKQPGPGLYPFLLGVIILPFSVILLLIGLKSEERESLFDKSALITFSLMVASFFLWIITLPFLGYVIGTLAVTYAFCKIMGLEGWIKPLIMSVCTALFVYLLFDVWLYIDFPRGLLEGIL